MRIVRYGPKGSEKPGLIDKDGHVRSLWPVIKDIGPDILSPDALNFLEAIDPARLPLAPEGERLGSPVGNIRQIIAIGLNYRDHAIEAKMPIPVEPVVFMKSVSSIAGPNDDTVLPPGSTKTDWEVELGIFIGSVARRVPKSEALQCVAGYCMVNDVSERDWQINRGGQWSKGKSFDTFTPVGPWLVTPSSAGDLHALELELSINGVRKQHGTTADMIFDVASLVSHLSEVTTLYPGDLIITGTPAGVGLGMSPQQFLKAGDVVDMQITGLGTQHHKVVAG